MYILLLWYISFIFNLIKRLHQIQAEVAVTIDETETGCKRL